MRIIISLESWSEFTAWHRGQDVFSHPEEIGLAGSLSAKRAVTQKVLWMKMGSADDKNDKMPSQLRHAWRDSPWEIVITKVLEHFLRGVLVENGAGKLKPWIRMKKALSAVNEPFFIFLKMVYHKVYPHFIWKKNTLNIIPDLRPRPLPCPWGERGGTERRRATKTWPRRFFFEWDKMVVFHGI